MKFTVVFKTPDAVCNAVNALNIDDLEQEDAAQFANKWVEYGEYVRIEFDTNAGTATVLKLKRE